MNSDHTRPSIPNALYTVSGLAAFLYTLLSLWNMCCVSEFQAEVAWDYKGGLEEEIWRSSQHRPEGDA